MRVLRWCLALPFLLVGGCARTLVVLSPAALPPTVGDTTLVITTRTTGLATPLPMRGEHSAWTGLDDALGRAIASAATPWANAHRAERPDGWQLLVDLWQASAERRGHTVTVKLGVRATLRTRNGNYYLAQTQAHCQRSLVDTVDAAPVFYGCMSSIGTELAGWLGGITP